MDLFTLVTGCASAIDPTIMPALIWYQSGGEPWSFACRESVSGSSIELSVTRSVPHMPRTQRTSRFGAGRRACPPHLDP